MDERETREQAQSERPTADDWKTMREQEQSLLMQAESARKALSESES